MKNKKEGTIKEKMAKELERLKSEHQKGVQALRMTEDNRTKILADVQQIVGAITVIEKLLQESKESNKRIKD